MGTNPETSGAVLFADPAQIRAWLDYVCVPGEVYELRAFDTTKATLSGYFNDPAALTKAAAMINAPEWSADGVYLTLNPVNPDLLARCVNSVGGWTKYATSDADILHRCWLVLDYDPVRPAGISSSDEQHASALTRARDVREHFAGIG